MSQPARAINSRRRGEPEASTTLGSLTAEDRCGGVDSRASAIPLMPDVLRGAFPGNSRDHPAATVVVLLVGRGIIARPHSPLRRYARPRRWRPARLVLAILGGCFLAVDIALWNTSVVMTSAASATLFANTAPLWVGLAARLFLHERLASRLWFALLPIGKA